MYEKFKDKIPLLFLAILITGIYYFLAYLLSARETVIDFRYFGTAFLVACVWLYFFSLYKAYYRNIICLAGIFTVLGFVVPWICYLTDPLIIRMLMKDLLLYTTLPLCILSVPLLTESAIVRKIVLCFSMFMVGILAVIISIMGGYYCAGHAKLATDEIIAVLQTSRQEAMEFLSSYFSAGDIVIFIILFLAVFTLIYILLRRIFVNFKSETAVSKSHILILLVLMCFSCSIFLTGTHTVGAIKSAVRTLKEMETFRSDREAKLQKCGGHEGNYSFALVIGESQTRTHMSAYGYKRKTTPWLQVEKDSGVAVLFPNSFSCAVFTNRALEMALTEKSQYNDLPLEDAMTIIEMARHAGYRTVWLDNQDSHTVASLVAWQADETVWVNKNRNTRFFWRKNGNFDDALVDKLEEMGKPGQKTLYVIHLFGSHVAYNTRYPESFNKWDEKKGKVNAYDNSILYNDHIMSELQRVLFNDLNVAGVIYFADHGEELNKYFGHGTEFFMDNYKKLPSAHDMVKIPVYMCFSETYRKENPEKIKNLNSNQGKYFSNDMIYDTLLGVMDIKCQHYDPKQDISTDVYNFSRDKLKTMYGKVKISEIN